MAVKKNNIRSFRYSDRVAEILEAMPGDSLNAKFENLVLEAYTKLPDVKRDLDLYKGAAERERQKYMELCKNREKLQDCLRLMDALENNLETVTQITAPISEAGAAAE